MIDVQDEQTAFARGKVEGYREHAALMLELIRQGHTARDLKASIENSLHHLGEERKE